MIQQGIDTVAAGYDHPSLSFFPEAAKRLVEHLQLNPTDNLLDVCTGIGIDLSSGMLQQAKNKAAELNLNNTEYKQMGLEHLEFDSGTFDVATSSFGLFFLEDMTKGLTNIASTIKPGGKVAITTFTGEAFSPMADIFIKRFETTGRPKHANLSHNMELESSPVRGTLAWQIAQES